MKTFKQYIKTKKEKGVIPSPIHFKHFEESYVDNIKEEAPESSKWAKENDNSHISNTGFSFKDNDKVSEHLHQGENLDHSDHEHIASYTGSKAGPRINKALMSGGLKTKKHKDTVEKLDGIIDKNRLRTRLHTYSGVTFDPTEHTDEKGLMKSPSYISTTHDKTIAAGFAEAKTKKSSKVQHVIHFQLEKGDPAFHIGQHSDYPEENETLIKRGVTLRHHGHTDYPTWGGKTLRVHKMSIVRD